MVAFRNLFISVNTREMANVSVMDRMACIDDLRIAARKRLPRFAFDFIDGGAETEFGLVRNISALQDIQLVPRYLVDVSAINTEARVFGKNYAVPFGMAPIGFLNMAWPGTDMMVARLAAARKMLFTVSAGSSTSLEQLAIASDGLAWFQIYISNDEDLTRNLLGRAEVAGYEVLVVTVDVPQPGKRDRDIRNGLKIPFKPTMRTLIELMSRPRWSVASLRNGPPRLGNFSGVSSAEFSALSLPEIQARLISHDFDWDDLKRLRARWRGALVIKGILHPDDAVRAVEVGCDGIIVSNHGGRQADYAPAPVSALPGIVKACDGRIAVMMDGGIRRGADIVRARALGADVVFTGRPFAFGAAAGGEDGVNRAFDILRSELEFTLGQIGQPVFEQVDRSAFGERA
jgi:(S)-mandelate dehydrogenase